METKKAISSVNYHQQMIEDSFVRQNFLQTLKEEVVTIVVVTTATIAMLLSQFALSAISFF